MQTTARTLSIPRNRSWRRGASLLTSLALKEGNHALRFEQARQPPVNRAHPCRDGRRRLVHVCERALDVIQDIEQRKNHFTLARLGDTRALALNAPSVVLEVGQVAQVDFMLAAQLFFEPGVLGLKLFGAGLPPGLGLRFARLRGPIMIRLCVIHGAVSSGSHRIRSVAIRHSRSRKARAARYLLSLNSASITSSPPPAPPGLGPPPVV